jgi:hypothetical protein
VEKKNARTARRIDKWLPIEKGSSRDNPDSVRRFLFDLICESFERDTVPLAEAAEKVIADLSPGDRRRYHRRRDAEWYYQATRNKKIIHYGDLEVLARMLGVPTALIMLYTRLYSEFQVDGRYKADKARLVLEALRPALEKALEIVSDHAKSDDPAKSQLTFADFEKIRRAYIEERDTFPLMASSKATNT